MFINFNMKKMIVIAILGGPLGLAMASGVLDHHGQTAAQEVAALDVGNVGQGSGGVGYVGYSYSDNGGNSGQVETIGQIGERLGGVFRGLREAL
ncbi:hypothetical protein BBC27_08750 [Acidithiobacillus ferrivorans]|uniref:Uncharacterized protein n=1 Tax=Acidithiobacillus ferrivorans TaxID=160808 RepID=A0A1B9BZY1_9PROT|nr:hypothetical protein [Acidithiobacillus ferrivorans]OCB03272.1 hypothetical protein BBC27_08750 [Acidithiobacillus ferrivorans]